MPENDSRPRFQPHDTRLVLLALPTQSSQESGAGNTEIPPQAGRLSEIICTAHAEFWQPGRLHPNLSWTHYRTLLRVDNADAWAFYEIEAIENRWSARELERQINSLLYERLALSKDKKGLMRLATKGQEIQQPTDIFKDPVVIEFLDRQPADVSA